MAAVLSISNLGKTYQSGFVALKNIELQIERGEIFALLGPNGAGKTTLISIVCGIVTPTSGKVAVNGHDIARDYRKARAKIGLVPQELTTDAFETVWATVNFSRGLFGLAHDPARIEKVLKDLALWDKRKEKIMALSGGMKRRVMIAKALSHEPEVLFLDEPSAGVDVELRREMWALIGGLKEHGVTIILTTHYIDEAEQMADRIGILSKGELIVVNEKASLMQKLGKQKLTLKLEEPMQRIPEELSGWPLVLSSDGFTLEYGFDANDGKADIPSLLRRVSDIGIRFKDLNTGQTSLEEIFVSLVGGKNGGDS